MAVWITIPKNLKLSIFPSIASTITTEQRWERWDLRYKHSFIPRHDGVFYCLVVDGIRRRNPAEVTGCDVVIYNIHIIWDYA